eukprot:3309361-Pyramimonas_sp.AAC.1
MGRHKGRLGCVRRRCGVGSGCCVISVVFVITEADEYLVLWWRRRLLSIACGVGDGGSRVE